MVAVGRPWISTEELYDAAFPWTIVDGRVYDLGEFLPRHPGGPLIRRAVGEDATALFHAHHISSLALEVLRRYEIGPLREASGFVHGPRPPPHRPLRRLLNERVAGLEKAPATPLAEVVAVSMLLLFVVWVALCYAGGWWRLNVLLAWFWWRHLDSGLHSAAHGDFRRSAACQRWLFVVYSILTHKAVEYYAGGGVLRGIGLSKHLWHHVYTNDPDRDPDWATMTGDVWVRRHASASWRPFHRWQRRYWLLVTCTVEPLLELLQASVNCLEAAAALLEVPSEATPPFLSRLLHAFATWAEVLVNPGYQGAAFFFQPWWRALSVVLLVRGVSRLVLFPFSEVQHYMPEHIVKGLGVGSDGGCRGQGAADEVEEEWVVTQLRSTANLRLTNPVAQALDFLMFHGDSYQIEHHLWPAMSFVNYRRAARIVRATCREFGLPYHEIGYWEGYARIWRQVCEHAEEPQRPHPPWPSPQSQPAPQPPGPASSQQARDEGDDAALGLVPLPLLVRVPSTAAAPREDGVTPELSRRHAKRPRREKPRPRLADGSSDAYSSSGSSSLEEVGEQDGNVCTERRFSRRRPTLRRRRLRPRALSSSSLSPSLAPAPAVFSAAPSDSEPETS